MVFQSLTKTKSAEKPTAGLLNLILSVDVAAANTELEKDRWRHKPTNDCSLGGLQVTRYARETSAVRPRRAPWHFELIASSNLIGTAIAILASLSLIGMLAHSCRPQRPQTRRERAIV
jgi:hypothetical protein